MVMYGSRAALAMARRRAAMRAGYAALQFGYKHRKTIGKAARVVRKTVRRRRRKPMKARTQPNAQASGKQTQDLPDSGLGTFIPYGTLRQERVLDAPPSFDGSFNSRDKAHVYYSGYKLCRIFENITQGDDSAAIEVHYALVQFSKQAYAHFLDAANVDNNGSVTDAELRNQFRQNFFRATNNVQTRAGPFNDYGANSIWRQDMNCLPMNPANGYKIIFHKKRVLFPRNLNNSSRKYYWKFDKFIPVKKRIEFRNRSDGPSLTPFYEIYWCNTLTPAGLPTNNVNQGGRVRTVKTHKLYFRD